MYMRKALQGSVLEVSTGGIFLDTRSRKMGLNGRAALVAFGGGGGGPDKGIGLQLGTSLADPRLPLSAAKNQECS